MPADCSLYGLGESTLPGGLLLPRNGHTMTLWSRDKSAAYVNANLYGTHSFYLQVNKGVCPAWSVVRLLIMLTVP